MRVLHVLEALEGGTSRHLIDVVRNVADVEHEVAIPQERRGGLTDHEAQARLAEAGATVHLVAMRRTPWSPANASALVALARLVRRRRPHVVHGHSSIGGLLGRLAATSARVPAVYTPNGITDVRIGRRVERALRPLTARLVAVSSSEASLALALGLVPPERLALIPNGVAAEDPPPVDLRAQLGIDPTVPLVGTIARLVPQKAPEDFVATCAQVAAAHPTVRFVLIGGGELEGEVTAAIEAAGLEGRLTRIDQLPGAAGAVSQLDVFVLTSRFEGGPYAPLEAMRAGTAVVLTDVVGSRDVVDDGTTGRLVPAGDPARTAAVVLELLADDEQRRRLGAAGRASVLADFRVDEMGRRLRSVYDELASLGTPSDGG